MQLHYNATLHISAYNRLKQRLPVYRQNFNSHTTSPGPNLMQDQEKFKKKKILYKLIRQSC